MARASDELLSTLFECHGGALRRYTHSLTRNAALTEDIVQETMLRAWQRPKVLELDKDAAQAWLFTVARRLVIDDARSARSRREVAAPGEVEGLLSIALMPSWTASSLRTRWRRSPTTTVRSSSMRTSLVRAFLKFRDGLASQKEPRNRGSTMGYAG